GEVAVAVRDRADVHGAGDGAGAVAAVGVGDALDDPEARGAVLGRERDDRAGDRLAALVADAAGGVAPVAGPELAAGAALAERERHARARGRVAGRVGDDAELAGGDAGEPERAVAARVPLRRVGGVDGERRER